MLCGQNLEENEESVSSGSVLERESFLYWKY